MITAEEARETWSYDPLEGILRWKINAGKRARKGTISGHIFNHHASSYLCVVFKGKNYRSHRICWLIHYGVWPSGQIDHIDHDGLNNKIENLRDVTASENMRNQRLRENNTTGAHGVYWNEKRKRWVAKIGVNGRVIELGRFIKIEDAIACRKEADRKHGFSPTHGDKFSKDNS